MSGLSRSGRRGSLVASTPLGKGIQLYRVDAEYELESGSEVYGKSLFGQATVRTLYASCTMVVVLRHSKRIALGLSRLIELLGQQSLRGELKVCCARAGFEWKEKMAGSRRRETSIGTVLACTQTRRDN